MIGDAATRTLLALLVVYERDGRATVRSVAHELGRSYGPTFQHLRRLRSAGLVAWEQGHTGTLRPLVGVVSSLTA